MRKHRDIMLVTTEARKNHLVSRPNYLATIGNILVIGMK